MTHEQSRAWLFVRVKITAVLTHELQLGAVERATAIRPRPGNERGRKTGWGWVGEVKTGGLEERTKQRNGRVRYTRT